MPRIANRDAARYVSNQQDFTGNNLYSKWKEGRDGGRYYVVYSYGKHWPLAIHKGGKWYINASKYSKTTTRHKNYVRKGIPGYAIPAFVEDMKRLDAGLL